MTDPLQNVPAIVDEAEAEVWANRTLEAIASQPGWQSGSLACVTAESPDARFVLGMFLADWACYSKPADRADFKRLQATIRAFPSGFRLWLCRRAAGDFMPVGYTGWYPISAATFATLLERPERLTHRGMIAPAPPDDGFIYLFNYSVIPEFLGTPESGKIVKALAADMTKLRPRGMAAVTVSEHGARVAERFGLHATGDMTHDGEKERVFAARF